LSQQQLSQQTALEMSLNDQLQPIRLLRSSREVLPEIRKIN